MQIKAWQLHLWMDGAAACGTSFSVAITACYCMEFYDGASMWTNGIDAWVEVCLGALHTNCEDDVKL
jgi:hypothetical protein